MVYHDTVPEITDKTYFINSNFFFIIILNHGRYSNTVYFKRVNFYMRY